MYMTELIVIATRYIFLLLKLRITFVPFLTAGSAANTRVNECHSFTDRVKNPTKLKVVCQFTASSPAANSTG